MISSALPLSAVRLLPGTYDRRRRINRDYLAALDEDALVQNHRIEAGIGDQGWHLSPSTTPGVARGWGRHWGWETPGAQLRGHFLGHWLSGAAREVAVTGDPVLRGKLQVVLDALEECQDGGDGWVFGVPPAYLRRLGEGREVWAPQYNIHKTLMGLVDVYRDLADERALAMAHRASGVIAAWARGFDTAAFQEILEVETGGMLEVWADLLEATGDDMYRDLIERYVHRSLFDGLLEGRDMLTNMHANTTIPEVLGAARAFEVTGDPFWRRVVEAYWDWAVTRRGTFCTGGQTSGEIWTPPHAFASRRGRKTQEHCSVYNMIRLADVLYRWTGDAGYLDYIEANLVNGILAQQHPETGMVAYFLPLESGATKAWGSPTEDFWCCHGTLVQAHTRHSALALYTDEDGGVTIAQYLPLRAELSTPTGPATVQVRVLDDARYVGPDANAGPGGDLHRPHAQRLSLGISSEGPVRLRLRVPAWTVGEPEVRTAIDVARAGRFLELAHPGGTSAIEVAFPFAVRAVPIPDEETTVAFVEGATVLAGLVDREVSLVGDPGDAAALLRPDDERQWSQWLTRYRITGQASSIRLVPLHEVVDEPYAVYFPVRPPVAG